MTTELEQEFYKTFEIEPISKWHKCKDYSCVCCDEYDNCSKREFIYPEITDRKLLKMICINSYFCGVNFHHLWVKNPDEIKAIILDEIIRWYQQKKYGHEKCKCQIQQLFKEE
jgi:hypothetical protein